jgi:ABC-2 type transport system ATP-binding protein
MTAGEEVVIDVKGLVRTYHSSSGLLHQKRTETVAVDHIDLEVRRNELFGLLGPNGAGKTTTIKVLTTLLLPTEGSVRILGYDVVRQSMEVRRRIGLILGGERGLYYRISARQNLRYFADIYGVPLSVRERRIAEVLEKVGLTDKADIRVEDYSRGMKQRLHIAKGIIHDPELIFMDEPTIGLDPQAAREARDMTKALVKDGKTIMLTTHYMFEADEICDRLAIISNGRIKGLGSPYSMKDAVRNDTVIEVEAYEIDGGCREKLEALPGVFCVSLETLEGRQLARMVVEDGTSLIPSVASILEGRKIISIRVDRPTLEDAYIKLVNAR